MIALIRSTVRGPDDLDELAYSHEEARRKVADQVMKAMLAWLEEHNNMMWARGHRLIVRSRQGLSLMVNEHTSGGLMLVETCLEPPCAWMGQAADDMSVIERTIMSAWYVAQE